MLANFTMWSLILNVIILIVTIGGFLKVLKNDLVHVGKSLEEIKKNLDLHGLKIDNIVERVSCMEGIMGVNAKRLKRCKKR